MSAPSKYHTSGIMCQVLLALLLAGCGYTTRSSVSSRYKTIYIPPFANKIDITNEANTQNKYRLYRPRLESDITKAVSNKFLFDGNVRPVNSELADVVLKGELLEFRSDPLRYDDNNEVQEYRISIRVNLKLEDKRNVRLIWEENSFAGETTYFTPGHTGSKTEETAINDAITDLARRVVERCVEEW